MVNDPMGNDSRNSTRVALWGAIVAAIIVAVGGLLAALIQRPIPPSEPPPIASPTTPSSSDRPMPSNTQIPSNSSPAPSPIGRALEVRLERKTGVDLDSGQKAQRFPSTGADVGIGPSETFDFQSGSDSTVYLMAAVPSIADCKEAAASRSSEQITVIGLEDLPVGSSMCVTTDQGLIASLTVIEVRNDPYDKAMIAWKGTVWE